MISAPTENEMAVMGMDEYIEREAAIESIMSEPPDAHYPHWYADKIKYIPAANVAPVRHGKNLDAEWPSLFTCSACGWSDGDTTTGDTISYNYCPNCGAKMDLKEG